MSLEALCNVTVTIQRATRAAESTTGHMADTWSDNLTNVRAVLHEPIGNEPDFAGAERQFVSGTLTVPGDRDILASDRIVYVQGSTTRTLQIQAVRPVRKPSGIVHKMLDWREVR